MLPPEMLQVLLGVVTGVLGLGGSYLVYRGATRGKKIEAEATPYGELRLRVAELEREASEASRRLRRLERSIGDLEEDLDRVVDALWEQWTWDGEPPQPSIARAALEIMHRRRNARLADRLPESMMTPVSFETPEYRDNP